MPDHETTDVFNCSNTLTGETISRKVRI